MRAGDLFDLLGIHDDEVVVVTAVLATGIAEEPVLLHGSALAVPAAAGTAGWPAWRVADGGRPATSEAAAQLPGTFTIELPDHVVGRAVLSRSEARAWLRRLIEEGCGDAIGELPAFAAQLSPARAPIRIMSQSDTDAGAFVCDLVRPFDAFLFGASLPVEDPPAIPDEWTAGDDHIFNGAFDLLGLAWFASRTTPMRQGMLVGRADERARLTEHRLTEDGQFTVGLIIDPDAIDLADLEVEIEERVDDEFVWSDRVALDDLDLDKTLDKPSVTLTLPSIGWGGVKRHVRLRHRDGKVLDEWKPFIMVERVQFAIHVGSPTTPPTLANSVTAGSDRPPLELVDLLGATQRITAELTQMRREGLARRLMSDPAKARDALRRLLERAHGEVEVIDPYFTDWELLEGLPSGPARVLLGARAHREPPPDCMTRLRQWRATKKVPDAPFHDRFVVWDGGGVSIGTSVGSASQRYFRLSRIGAAEAAELRDRFALWWHDDGFGPDYKAPKQPSMPLQACDN
ncbi:MAG: hypothetical protein JWQ20_2849 [Conexibacter sp.]|nr:hypothetical protein [Conexibacter sp.]